jgi:ferredoxin-NADP reductase
VAEVVPEGGSVTSYVLSDNDPLPPFAAGQFVTVRAVGAGDPAPVRSYSLSSDALMSRYRISVKREPLGLVSSYLHDRLRVGGRLDVAAPRGAFVLDDSSDPLLLVSAGIGVTPVLAMLHELARLRSSRDVWWIHTTRDPNTHTFSAEASALVAGLPSAHQVVHYSGADGRMTEETLAALGLPAGARAYVCGPEPFMDDATGWLLGLGVAEVHTERFGSRPPLNPGVVPAIASSPHPPPGPAGDGPTVTFVRSGVTASWSEGYRSVLELAEACEVPTRWSCRSGVCHTCVTPVLSGEATYVTEPLEAPGPDELLICVGRPTTELVLDL